MARSVHETSLRGRDREVRGSLEDLRDPDVRAVALTGLAGVGKSRIAAAVAQRVEADAGRTVTWVEIARIPAPELLESAIAKAAGLASWDPETSGGLSGALDTSRRLVVLDGVDFTSSERSMHERLLELVTRCRTTKFLITGRSPGIMPGGRVRRVEPFPTPAVETGPEARENPGVALFVDVSKAVGAATPGEDDLADVAGVVGHLGGNPLAITLAASRSAAFSPATLREMLGRPTPNPMFASSVLAETGTLGASIEWSIEQLSKDHAAVLRDLLAFHAAVPIDAVEAVSETEDVIGALSLLVDVHLVDADHGGVRTTFSLPPIVREHVAQQTSPDLRDELRDRRQRWAVDLARRASATGAGEAHSATVEVRLVEAELLSALRRALDAADASDAGALVVALAPLWLGGLTHDVHLELVRRAAGALTADHSGDEDLALVNGWYALLLAERASGTTTLHAIDEASERALDLARELDPIPRLRVLALVVRTGRVYVERAPFVARCNEAIELATELGAEAILARFEIWAAMLSHQEGDLERASQLGVRARERGHLLDDASLTVTATAFLRTLPGRTTAGLDLPSAAQLVEAARACNEERVLLWMLPSASLAALAADDLHAATEYDIELLERGRDAAVWGWTALPTINQADIAVRAGDSARAARLHGMATNHRHLLEAMLPPARFVRWTAARDEVRAEMGDTAYEAAVAAGAMLTPGDATAEVLDSARRFLATAPGVATAGQDTDTEETSPLTAREIDVLELLVDGDSNKDIAENLGISPKTVMHHTSSIYRKLQVRGRAEAVAWAVRRAA